MGSKKYFDKIAQQWDSMQKSFFSEKVREKAFEIAKIKSGRTAADIGTGTGFVIEGLIKRNLNVIAVDQSEKMLNELKKKFSDNNIDCRVGDAEKIPITDEAVDYVFANMCLHHVEKPKKAILEMARILKPNGKLVITDLDKHNFKFLKEEHSDRWLGFKREQIKEWLSEAKLKSISVDCANETCCSKSCCSGEKAEISIFVAHGEK